MRDLGLRSRTGSAFSQLGGVRNRLPTDDEYASLGPWFGLMSTLVQGAA